MHPQILNILKYPSDRTPLVGVLLVAVLIDIAGRGPEGVPLLLPQHSIELPQH